MCRIHCLVADTDKGVKAQIFGSTTFYGVILSCWCYSLFVVSLISKLTDSIPRQVFDFKSKVRAAASNDVFDVNSLNNFETIIRQQFHTHSQSVRWLVCPSVSHYVSFRKLIMSDGWCFIIIAGVCPLPACKREVS